MGQCGFGLNEMVERVMRERAGRACVQDGVSLKEATRRFFRIIHAICLFFVMLIMSSGRYTIGIKEWRRLTLFLSLLPSGVENPPHKSSDKKGAKTFSPINLKILFLLRGTTTAILAPPLEGPRSSCHDHGNEAETASGPRRPKSQQPTVLALRPRSHPPRLLPSSGRTSQLETYGRDSRRGNITSGIP